MSAGIYREAKSAFDVHAIRTGLCAAAFASRFASAGRPDKELI